MKIVPVVGVVYFAKDRSWRGFCYPYDVTCNAENKEDAKKRLIELIRLYEESLERYKNPRHLILRGLSEREDKMIFTKIWPEITKKISGGILKAKRNPSAYSDYISSINKEFSVERSAWIKGVRYHLNNPVPGVVHNSGRLPPFES